MAPIAGTEEVRSVPMAGTEEVRSSIMIDTELVTAWGWGVGR